MISVSFERSRRPTKDKSLFQAFFGRLGIRSMSFRPINLWGLERRFKKLESFLNTARIRPDLDLADAVSDHFDFVVLFFLFFFFSFPLPFYFIPFVYGREEGGNLLSAAKFCNIYSIIEKPCCVSPGPVIFQIKTDVLRPTGFWNKFHSRFKF